MYPDILENELPTLLENLSLKVRQNICFQHMWFQFNAHWIGKAGPVNWRARLPDLSSADFFLWVYLKNKLYKSEPTIRVNMTERIRNAWIEIQADTFLSVHSNALNSKTINLSTYFNWKIMRRRKSCKLSTLISERPSDSQKSSSLIGEKWRESPKSSTLREEGTHLNQVTWYVKDKVTHSGTPKGIENYVAYILVPGVR